MSSYILATDWVDYRTLGSFEHFLKAADGKFIIAGYASFDTIDQQKEKVNLEALADAFQRMMSVTERRNIMFHHSNMQIGRILPTYTDTGGRVWKSGADEHGLFIVAEIFGDTVKGRDIISLMMKGRYLAFSIGGQALQRKTECNEDICWKEITKLDLYEVTSCERGVNQSAKGFLLDNTFTNIAKLDENNDTFISNKQIDDDEGSLMPEDTKPEVTEKSDLQEVLDAVTKLSEMVASTVEKNEVEEPEVVETVVVPEALSKDDIMAMITAAIATANPAPVEEVVEEVVEEKPENAITYYYKAPVEDDFKDKDEYQKALAEYNKLVETLKENIEPEEAELVAKSVDTDDANGEEIPSFQKIWDAANGGLSLSQLLTKTGVN